jgi:aminoglycoside/choline kinase family phosphotransferase
VRPQNLQQAWLALCQHTCPRPSQFSISSISTKLWRYRIDINNWLPIHFHKYIRCRYRRYQQCCDDTVSISTNSFLIRFYVYMQCRFLWYRQYDDIVSISIIDFPYTFTCTCTYDVNIVNIDNVVTIWYRYRQLTFHTLLYICRVSILSISAIL